MCACARVCIYLDWLIVPVRMAERVGRVIQARSELCTTRTLKYRSAVDPSSIIRRAFKCFSGSTTERFHTANGGEGGRKGASIVFQEGRGKESFEKRDYRKNRAFRAIKKKKLNP